MKWNYFICRFTLEIWWDELSIEEENIIRGRLVHEDLYCKQLVDKPYNHT